MATELGIKEGYAAIVKERDATGKAVNGWRISSDFGDRAFYNGNFTLRAAGALAGLYGNGAVEAMYPLAVTDHLGKKLDGSKANYTITFPAGSYPPVNAFWSVTMYDGKTQLLIANPINRYLINSPMLPDLRKNGRWLIDDLCPEQIARQRQGIQLAAGTQWSDLHGDAALLAERGGSQRNLETCAHRSRSVRIPTGAATFIPPINSAETPQPIPRQWALALRRCRSSRTHARKLHSATIE